MIELYFDIVFKGLVLFEKRESGAYYNYYTYWSTAACNGFDHYSSTLGPHSNRYKKIGDCYVY
jgi:hypothetical protein